MENFISNLYISFMKIKPENAYLIEWAIYVVLFVGWLIFRVFMH